MQEGLDDKTKHFQKLKQELLTDFLQKDGSNHGHLILPEWQQDHVLDRSRP